MIFFFFKFNFLRGRKFRWGVFKGARGDGFGVGRFKRGADLEHNRHFMPNFIIAEKSQLGANKNNLSISLLLVISLQTSQHGLFDTVYHYFTTYFTKQYIWRNKRAGVKIVKKH